MIKITLNDLFDLKTSVIYNPDNYKPVTSVSIDSRNIKSNSLFVAIAGEKFDGHEFAKQALQSGAAAILINKNRLAKYSKVDNTIVAVDDTVKALGELANIWRKKLNAKVISITGSNGKTSTKEILFTLLSEKYKVVRTVSNNNNHIGVPITIFTANSESEFLILEHGTNHFNEIEYTSEIAQPDYGLITNIGNSHLEYLNDKAGVFNEKKVLLDKVYSNKGTVFINADDKFLKKYLDGYKKRITFGFNSFADIQGKILNYSEEGRPVLQIKSGKKILTFEVPIYGISNAKNILAAVSVCIKLGLNEKQILSGIKKIEAVKGRLQTETFSKMILINDTYNANPESMKAAIDVIKKIKVYKNKYLVLGDMFELGEKAVAYHKELAELISSVKPVKVLLIGKFMKYLTTELKAKSVSFKHFSDRNKMSQTLSNYDFSNSIVLVKGSRGMKMEEMVEAIKMGIK
jgi:UDP-N-acetylmuramoyl-tripeptide--D-alanyl-D-alanine ligase